MSQEKKLVGVMMRPKDKEALEELARAKGTSVSSMCNRFITKNVELESGRGGQYPTLAELGSEDGIRDYMSLRFGLDQPTAASVLMFFKHLASTAADPIKVLALRAHMEGRADQPPTFESKDEFKAALMACGEFGSDKVDQIMRMAGQVAQ
jgi:hypothetical protein